MNPYRRWITFAIFIVSCVALGLASAAFATKCWTQGTAKSHSSLLNTTQLQEETEVAFGLFSGTKSQTIILITTSFNVKDKYNECNDFMNFGLWICTIMFLALGMIFGIVSAVFSIINAIMTPVESITGLQGLYIWNGVACGCSLLSLIMYTVLFYVSFNGQVALNLARTDCTPIEGTEETSVGYSFWMVLGTTVFYVINIPLAFLAGRNWLKKQAHTVLEDQPADGLIMLY